MSALQFGEPVPGVVETPAFDGQGRRVPCPQPHFDGQGHPKTGPGAYRYIVGTTTIVACRPHAPKGARDALAQASDSSAPGDAGLWQ